MDSANSSAQNDSLTRQAAALSLVVSTGLLAFKFWGYKVTHSQAVFSDAMETIVNVVAAGLAMIMVGLAQKPADRDHPYGHGKVEFFSAAFEGGLIAFASVMICVEAAQTLIRGVQVDRIGLGLAVTVAAGAVNAVLGIFLLTVGRRHKSSALEASGLHVLSDFVTSAGVAVGLLLVHFTGLKWIDPVVALIVGLYLGFTGVRLVRGSVAGLLDEEDQGIIKNLLAVINRRRPAEIIHIHHARVLRSGRFHHIDAHAVVPEFWDVAEAHDRTGEFEARLMMEYPYPGELHLHVDPCRRAFCRVCQVSECPIRRQAFESVHELSVDELTSPEEPQEFIARRLNPAKGG